MSFPVKLLEYYSKELNTLKHYGIMFSKKFPDIAKRLGFIDGKSEDPHVERLVESFALLTAQLQQRIDEDLPELSLGVLETLMPQAVRPIPSVTVVQCHDNPGASVRQKVLMVPRHTLLHCRESNGDGCRFRTCYPLLILPIQLTSVALVAKNYENDWQLSLTLLSNASSLPVDASLRIYLAGESDFNQLFYEALLSQVHTLEYCQHDKKLIFSSEKIKPVGFESENYLCADDLTIDPVHHLIRDYAVFRERFLFIDLPLPPELFVSKIPSPISVTVKFNNSFVISKLGGIYQQCNISNIKLNCVPAANLFTLRSEPITPDANIHEYLLNPDVRNKENYEIYSVNNVELKRKQDGITETYSIAPLFSSKLLGCSELDDLLWQSTRKKILQVGDEVSNTFLSFAETDTFSLNKQTDIISASLVCINKQGISELTTDNPEGDFLSQIDLPGIRICGLMRPRLPIQPQLTNQQQWHLVSQLSLNKTLYSGGDGVKILKKALEVYNIERNQQFSHMTSLIIDMQVIAISGRLYPDDPLSIARGLSLTLTFHKTTREHAGFYLFCSILEKFVGQYAPVNSFIQTTIHIESEDEPHSVWPKRAGNLVWL
ncbi:type VI secretion protein [Enterobacter kobei]|uniref:type VI secretion system baseplate subunit TssF n=1 Tax=Enterobacter kobei TaxID=208224 RepID=UPI00125C3CC4|nr:type VI secretion system baseplate subunit TssF [Enterobacter kobei]VAL43562.1 type VI secretion protein [Enterobacter kobei]